MPRKACWDFIIFGVCVDCTVNLRTWDRALNSFLRLGFGRRLLPKSKHTLQRVRIEFLCGNTSAPLRRRRYILNCIELYWAIQSKGFLFLRDQYGITDDFKMSNRKENNVNKMTSTYNKNIRHIKKRKYNCVLNGAYLYVPAWANHKSLIRPRWRWFSGNENTHGGGESSSLSDMMLSSGTNRSSSSDSTMAAALFLPRVCQSVSSSLSDRLYFTAAVNTRPSIHHRHDNHAITTHHRMKASVHNTSTHHWLLSCFVSPWAPPLQTRRQSPNRTTRSSLWWPVWTAAWSASRSWRLKTKAH